MHHMSLISIALPKPFTRQKIETCLDCSLQKGVEKSFFAQDEERYIIFTQFNVITFIHYTKEELLEVLHKLHLKHAHRYEEFFLFQDYPIRIDPQLESFCHINNDHIVLKNQSTLLLIIIALVISQSVGLEKYEKELEAYFERSKQLIELTNSYSPFKRAKLTRFISELTLSQYDMVSDLFLLDKPNILWENEDAENLYNDLSSILELKDRFEIVEYKLEGLKDDIDMVIDLSNHKHSETLDWIVIILITVAIGIMLLEFIFA